MKRKIRFISQKSRPFRLQLPYFFSNRNAKYIRMFRKEARAEGLAEGRVEGIAHILNVIVQKGASIKQISALTGMSVEETKNARRAKKENPLKIFRHRHTGKEW